MTSLRQRMIEDMQTRNLAWLFDLLKPHVTKLVVCDPRKNALLKTKCGVTDSDFLAGPTGPRPTGVTMKSWALQVAEKKTLRQPDL